MKAGIWLEIEAVSGMSEAYEKYYDGIYKSCGFPIGADRNALMDFRNEAFSEHIENVIDKLYNMGIRYIKND
jgi:alpha-galactosidase